MSDLKFIHERLDNLYEVDTKLVSSLDNLSSILSTLHRGKTKGNDDELEKEFVENVRLFYTNLSKVSIELRKEIRCLDDKISNNQGSGEGSFSILPININKKAVWTGDHKLKQEIEVLDRLLDGELDTKEEDLVKE